MQEDQVKERESSADRFYSRTLPSITAIALAIISAVLGYFFKDFQDTLRDLDGRIKGIEALDIGAALGRLDERLDSLDVRMARLEEKFSLCVECTKVTVRRFGDFEWSSVRAYDTDPAGNINLGVDIDILSEQLRWKCASSRIVLWDNSRVDLGAIIAGYTHERELQNALGLVALGTASSEGREILQERLASARLETLFTSLDQNLEDRSLPIYGLRLGQYVAGDNDLKCSQATIDQRRIVILKIIELRSDMDHRMLENSLKRILEKKALTPGLAFPIDITDYSVYRKRQPMLIHGRNVP